MTPVEQAKRLLGKEWTDSLEAHLLTGHVICAPDAFLMGKPVPWGADVTDPWQVWPWEQCNAWFVWCFVGNLSRVTKMIPWRLPWIGFIRRHRGWEGIHWIDADRLCSRLERNSVRVSTCQASENSLKRVTI